MTSDIKYHSITTLNLKGGEKNQISMCVTV